MSGDRRTPHDWRHGGPLPEEAPHLRARPLRDDPEVQGLLDELSQGLKPGEDPLFYELPEAPDDPDACAPNEARVYVAPTAPPKAHHQTLELERVKVAPAVDPRRAVTQRVEVKRPADPRDDAPPMSGPAGSEPKSAAGRTRTVLALALGAVAAALVVLAATWAPKTPERPAASATAGAAESVVPFGIAAPAATAAATGTQATTATPATTASAAPSPVRPHAAPVRPVKEDDPYDAATPLPATAAPSTTPAPPPPPPPPPAPTKQLVEDKPVY